MPFFGQSNPMALQMNMANAMRGRSAPPGAQAMTSGGVNSFQHAAPSQEWGALNLQRYEASKNKGGFGVIKQGLMDMAQLVPKGPLVGL